MTLSVAAASYLNWPVATKAATTNTQPGPSDNSAPKVGVTSGPITLTAVSASGLPRIQMPSGMLAQIQSGSVAPDPAKTAAQNATPAYSIIKDAGTGQILGGVWPGAATVSKINIPIDDRLTGNTDWAQATQILADDISRFTGKDVTIEYFRPGDPNAPTFGDIMG